jgi:hypothetical protein
MEDAGADKQNYAQKLEVANQARLTGREQAPDPKEAGQQRIQWLAEQYKKGKEAFDNGINRVKEVAKNVGQKAVETAEFVAGMPEWTRGKINNAEDWVWEQGVNFSRTMVRKDDEIAENVETVLKKITGAFEARELKIKAGVTEAKAKHVARQRDRVKENIDSGRQALMDTMAEKAAMIAELQQSIKEDKAQLKTGFKDQEENLGQLQENESSLSTVAESTRAEAEARKGNGRGLANLRKTFGQFIRA